MLTKYTVVVFSLHGGLEAGAGFVRFISYWVWYGHCQRFGNGAQGVYASPDQKCVTGGYGKQ